MSISSRCVTANRWIVHFQQVSPFLFDLRLRFRLRLCLDLTVQADTGTQLLTSLSVLFIGALAAKLETFSIS